MDEGRDNAWGIALFGIVLLIFAATILASLLTITID
jgi:hypothetical protein